GLEGRMVALSHPLAAERPGSERARLLVAGSPNVVMVDQLLVDRALPAAVRKALGVSRDEAFADDIVDYSDSGCPVFHPDDLTKDAPEPFAHLELTGLPTGAFVARLDQPTLERMPSGVFKAGCHVV